MASFEEEQENYKLMLASTVAKIRHLEYQLSVEKMNYEKLLHNKMTISRFQNFSRLSDGWLSFRCLKCGNRARGKSHAAKYCDDCKIKLRQEQRGVLGWGYNAEPKDSL